MLSQFLDCNQRYLAQQLHIHIEPARLFRRGPGVEIFSVAVELRGVWINAAADPGDTGDTRLLAVGMVEQRTVADPHLVAHEVTRLIVAHAVPRDSLFGHRGEIVDAAIGWLGF